MAPKRIRIELLSNTYHRKFHVTAQVSSERQHCGVPGIGSNRLNPFSSFMMDDQ